jgi:glycosyltransferase involved in cell wall biosynthesis
MKKISVIIPCYNDSNSVMQMRERLTKVFTEQLSNYDYEIIYVDDRSPDNGKTWSEIEKVCKMDPKVKGIRNVRNFGIARNVFVSLRYGTGDAVFMIFGDLQDPPETLPEMTKYWELGHKVVVGARHNQYYNPFINLMRKAYYYWIKKLSGNRQIEGINGFGLYDRSFVKITEQIEDTQPLLMGAVTEYAENIKIITVKQEKGGRDGKSNLNFWGKYDVAMISLTTYTKTLLRIITFIGAIIGCLSILFALVVFILKLSNWDAYPSGIPALTVGMFFLGGVQLFFLGIMGEYILSINNRVMKRPLAVIGERINFERSQHGKRE